MAVVTRDATRGRFRSRIRTLTWSLAIVPLTVLCVALAIVFAAKELYADRVLPGVTVAGVDVGSLPEGAVIERLQSELSRPWAESTIVATAEGRTWRTTNGALGVRPDLAAAVQAALLYGKQGSVFDQLGAWTDALRGGARIPLTLEARGDALDGWLASIAADLDRPAVAGSIEVGARGLVVTEPVIGRHLDQRATAAAVLAAQTLADRAIDLAVRVTYPAVDDAGSQDAVARARAVTTPLVVSVEDRWVNEHAAGLASLLRIERIAAKPGELPALPAGVIAPVTRYRYEVSIDQTRLGEWVKALGVKLDRPAVNAKYTVSREGTLAVVSGVAGIRLDQDRMSALMLDELLKPASSVRELQAPSGADSTAFTTEQAQQWLPQVTRTSTFTTLFPVSKSRHANIATGSAQFDGVVLMPGQTFSFWQLLG
ncbi:MAG: peptidoglycan binding domain-containing protein, partial [Chloroflexota bacterium]